MQKQKGIINILLIIIALVIIGAAVYVAFTRQMPLRVTAPSPSQSPGFTPQPEASICPLPQCAAPPLGCNIKAGNPCDPSFCQLICVSSTPKAAVSPSPTLRPKPNSTSYQKDGTCPPGYVNYGIPLQCVTPEYMEYCKNNPCPICLSGSTQIETPAGPDPVKDLQAGMPVWTLNKAGQRVSGIITKTSKVPVPLTHQMVHLVLRDGRELYVSSGHPTIDGRTIGELKPDDQYAGTYIASTELVPYAEGATFDILPSGETGFYWANGILIGSTLH